MGIKDFPVECTQAQPTDPPVPNSVGCGRGRAAVCGGPNASARPRRWTVVRIADRSSSVTQTPRPHSGRSAWALRLS